MRRTAEDRAETPVPVRVFRNALLHLPERSIEGDLLVKGNAIAGFGAPGKGEGAEIWDLDGCEVSPGLIDLHTHGGWGIDFYRDDAERIASVAGAYARAGVTRLLLTLHPGPADEMCDRIANAARVCAASTAFLGIHLEGPYLSRDRRGALPESGIHPWDVTLMERIWRAAGGKLRVMTFAPEALPPREIERIQARGVVLSIGHTAADAGVTEAAVAAGARRATHLCNAMPLIHHRDPGAVVPLLLDPRVRVEVIADGEHLDDRVLALVLRTKGDENVIAVSDSIPLAGSEATAADFAGARVRKEGNRAVLADGRLAGSITPLGAALERTRRALGLSPQRIATLGAAAPAADLRLPMAGRLASGCAADFLVRARDGRLVAAFRGGARADAGDEVAMPRELRRLR